MCFLRCLPLHSRFIIRSCSLKVVHQGRHCKKVHPLHAIFPLFFYSGFFVLELVLILVQRVLRLTRRGKLIHAFGHWIRLMFIHSFQFIFSLFAPIIVKYYEYEEFFKTHMCTSLHGLDQFHGVSRRAMERLSRILTPYGSLFSCHAMNRSNITPQCHNSYLLALYTLS